MLDFIYSNDPSKITNIQSSLKYVSIEDTIDYKIYSGKWGCLVVSGKAYTGFTPIENDQYILVVLGGPLPRHDYSVANGDKEDDGTKWIFKKWKLDKNIRWDEDIVGHYAIICIDKLNNKIEVVTDINSFIPIYYTFSRDNTNNIFISSHVDSLAYSSGKSILFDEVSILDFIMYSTITYPYTIYRNIYELGPSSLNTFINGDNIYSYPYWEPYENEENDNYKSSVLKLREILISNVNRICHNQNNVIILMSGGEDARAVSSIASKYTEVEGVSFLDSFNKEAKISNKIAYNIGYKWTMLKREKLHYLNNLHKSLKVISSSGFYYHAHSVGFQNNISSKFRVLGGYMADSWFKGYWINQNETVNNYLYNDNVPNLLKEVYSRRNNSLNELKKYRPISWSEWVYLWPANQRRTLSHFTANRRLFQIYEPFIDAEIVKLSSSIPQEWKINRKLFHAAMKPIFKETKFIPHPKGFYPYYGKAVNNVIFTGKYIPKKFINIFNRILNNSKRNQGSWSDWNYIINSEMFCRLYNTHINLIDTHYSTELKDIITNYIDNNNMGIKVKLLQVLIMTKQSTDYSLIDNE